MEPDIAAYAKLMEEIKKRTLVVQSFFAGISSAVFRAPQIECMYLQVRMILELIALASIAANKVVFEDNQRKFQKHWNPADILRDIETLNPGFYPIPIREVPSQRPGVKNDLVKLEGGFLTRQELIELHGRTGNILHAENPYGRGRDYDDYERKIPEILDKVHHLLNAHEIRLLGHHDFFYLVHMNAPGKPVHYYKFQKIAAP